MLDVARNIKCRFMNSKDIYNVDKYLKSEGYTTISGIYDDAKLNGETIYFLNVYKEDNLIVQVLYTLRDDDTDYKQYIYSIIY